MLETVDVARRWWPNVYCTNNRAAQGGLRGVRSPYETVFGRGDGVVDRGLAGPDLDLRSASKTSAAIVRNQNNPIQTRCRS